MPAKQCDRESGFGSIPMSSAKIQSYMEKSKDSSQEVIITFIDSQIEIEDEIKVIIRENFNKLLWED